MFRHRIDEIVPRRVYVGWFLLAFTAGSVNAGGFLAVERFVTHLTGFATLVGVDLAQNRWDLALGMLTVPLFFLFGVITAAYFLDRRIHMGLTPRYDWVMLAASFLLIIVAVAGKFRAFGTFGSAINIKDDYVMLSLLCLASGLQNAAITTSSRGTIRSTHLTGITTDLGISLMRIYSAKKGSDIHTRERRMSFVRTGSIASFIIGAILGAYLFVQMQYLGFLIPAWLCFFLAYYAFRDVEAIHAHSRSQKL